MIQTTSKSVSVKCSIVKCLYDCAKRIVTKPSVISKKKKHLSSILVCNAYPLSFLQKITKSRKWNTRTAPTPKFKTIGVLPYIKGLSEQLRPCPQQQQGVCTDIKSKTTLRSHQVQPKDSADLTKQDLVLFTEFPVNGQFQKISIHHDGRLFGIPRARGVLWTRILKAWGSTYIWNCEGLKMLISRTLPVRTWSMTERCNTDDDHESAWYRRSIDWSGMC